ncbi:MAG: hypothetical protein VW124_19765 [Paracoccaceae bacterium]
MENVVGIIPARAGSKRIKNKNLQLLNGLPLIDYTVQFANELNLEYCIISTDSQEIQERAFGKVSAPFLRPENASNDTATDKAWIDHALGWLKSSLNLTPEFLFILRPTSPLRCVGLAQKALTIARKNDLSVRSVCKIPSKHSPVWSICSNGHGFSNTFANGFEIRSQDIPQYFFPTGIYDIIHVATYWESENIYGDFFEIVEHPVSHINDIDTKEDLDHLNENFDTLRKIVGKY